MEQAIKEGELEEVRCLLDSGTSLTEAPDVETLYSPLHLACEHGYLPIAKFLIERGHPVDIIDAPFSTPFCFAAQKGSLDLVTLLLENGASFENEYFNQATVIQLENEDAPCLAVNVHWLDGASCLLDRGRCLGSQTLKELVQVLRLYSRLRRVHPIIDAILKRRRRQTSVEE